MRVFWDGHEAISNIAISVGIIVEISPNRSYVDQHSSLKVSPNRSYIVITDMLSKDMLSD